MTSKSRTYTALTALAFLAAYGPLRGATASESTPFDMASGATIDRATSTLVRSDSRVTATFLTEQLDPGSVQTLWWVVFNSPENCKSRPCGENDVFHNPAANPSVLFADGAIVDDEGRARFAATLNESSTTGALFGPGLLDAERSEVHVVTRTHGAPIPNQLEEQLTTFDGGCEQNACRDTQAAVHMSNSTGQARTLEQIRSMLRQILSVLNVPQGNYESGN